MSAQVQITVELLEKLAGIQRPPTPRQQQQQRLRQQQQQQHASQQFGRMGLHPGLHPELGPYPSHHHHHPHHAAAAAAALAEQQQLQASLGESRRVGELLLKAGDQELAAVTQRADELLGKFRSEIRPLPCGAAQEAVLQCYTDNRQDVLACGELVDAYLACARESAGKVLS